MTILGKDVATGQPVVLTTEARRQGVYVIGTTGTGKTTLLQNMAYQDMADPTRPGLCVLDPHGDFIDELLLRVPEDRADDVIVFDPGAKDQERQPLGLNLFDCDRDNPGQVRRVASTVVNTLRKLFFYSWGPRMEDLLRHSILTLMEQEETSLLELLLILASSGHRRDFTQNVKDPVLKHFWEKQFAEYDNRQRVEVVGSSLNKIGRFLVDPVIRHVVAQRHNAFNLRSIMDDGGILLVNLSKGDLGEDNSALLGSVLVNLILIAALERREVPVDERRPFHLIVDEYQSFATESFPTLQSEARKYGITVTVAHQYRDQLDELNMGSTLNVANFVVMRVSGIDSYTLAAQFDNKPPEPEIKKEPVYQQMQAASADTPSYIVKKSAKGAGTIYQDVKEKPRLYADVAAERANDLAGMPNRRALCRLMEDNRLVEHTIATYPPQGDENPDIADYVRQRSLALGTDKEEVREDIRRRIGMDFEDFVFDDASGLDPYEPDE